MTFPYELLDDAAFPRHTKFFLRFRRDLESIVRKHIITELQYKTNRYVGRMTCRATTHRSYSTTILECQLYRFRKTFLNKGEGIDKIAFPCTIWSNENCKRFKINRNLRDAFVIPNLHLLNTGNHKLFASTDRPSGLYREQKIGLRSTGSKLKAEPYKFGYLS